MFPVRLEELIPDDHVCRVIDAFVDRLNLAALGFERAAAAETGRPGCDPRDLLKLYLYGYLQQIPFATLKYRIFAHPRLQLRGRNGAQTEMSLAVMAYNLKRMINVLGGRRFSLALATS